MHAAYPRARWAFAQAIGFGALPVRVPCLCRYCMSLFYYNFRKSFPNATDVGDLDRACDPCPNAPICASWLLNPKNCGARTCVLLQTASWFLHPLLN